MSQLEELERLIDAKLKLELQKQKEEYDKLMEAKLQKRMEEIERQSEAKLQKQREEYEKRIQPRLRRTEFVYNSSKPLDGVIAHLTREYGGNVHDKGIVNVTASSVKNNDSYLKLIAKSSAPVFVPSWT